MGNTSKLGGTLRRPVYKSKGKMVTSTVWRCRHTCKEPSVPVCHRLLSNSGVDIPSDLPGIIVVGQDIVGQKMEVGLD